MKAEYKNGLVKFYISVLAHRSYHSYLSTSPSIATSPPSMGRKAAKKRAEESKARRKQKAQPSSSKALEISDSDSVSDVHSAAENAEKVNDDSHTVEIKVS